MPRKARIEFPGAVYHLLDRGDHREPIVRDDADRTTFLNTLGQVCVRTGWRVHAFVLMTNHYHLLVETPEANLVCGMRWFQTTYTVRFNRRHRVTGHLFQGRYKAIVVDPEESGYFALLSDYIHLNPVRARIISLRDRLYDFAWSSYRWYAATTRRPEWFEPGRVLAELGLEDNVSGRRHYAERMRSRAVDELAQRNDVANERLHRGWCLGGVGFRERMLALLERATEKLSQKKEVDAVVRRSHDDKEARRLREAALAYFNLKESDLPNLKRNDPRKLMLAQLIRQRTSVTNAWIARELSLGHASSVSRYSRIPAEGQTGCDLSGLNKWLEEGQANDKMPRF
jgi:REP element-mobilizing transposase RayT